MKRALLLGVLLAGCAQLPPSPQDIQAKRFEPVSDKAVIYVARPPLDSGQPGVVALNYGAQIATLGGTYNRIEVPSGTIRLDGIIPPSPSLTLEVQPGRIYYVRYTVFGGSRSGGNSAFLQVVNENAGRALVSQGSLYP